MDANPSPT